MPRLFVGATSLVPRRDSAAGGGTDCRGIGALPSFSFQSAHVMLLARKYSPSLTTFGWASFTRSMRSRKNRRSSARCLC